jgi:acyl-CoA thioesterase I
MKKIVIIADSLSLPRPKDLGDIPYEETYPYLLDLALRAELGNQAPIVMEKGKRARTITEVINDWKEYVTWRRPEVVIVHTGIVDCAPRVFLPKQQAFVDSIRINWIKKLILSFVRKYRRNIIKLFPNKVYTPLETYKSAVVELTDLAKLDGVKALIFIKTVTPPDDLEYRSPGFHKNVNIYNKALDQVRANPGVYLIELDNIFHESGNLEKYILNDGFHLSVEGNRVLAKQLVHLLNSISLC